MSDEFLTIASIGQGEYTDKRSKFIAFAHPVKSLDEIKNIVDNYRKEYYDARHICYAYMLGINRKEFRSIDDGEPSSTAGKPILGQINSNELTDILIVVVRYYGGINLGPSGLITAYRTAAALAIKNAQIVSRTIEEVVTFTFPYLMMNKVMRIIKEMNAQIIQQDFDNVCTIQISIARSRSKKLEERLEHLSFE